MLQLPAKAGFTLIEISIVLVIIGLITGGILVGQDLIRSAEVRAEISQIEKYNTAVRTFELKYNYLPGDIPNPYATQFGFQSRGTNAGQGDGNGIISGYDIYGAFGFIQCGEASVFWVDLSKAGLIDGSFSTASPTSCPGSDATGQNIEKFLPKGRIGNSLYVYVMTAFSPPPAATYNYNPAYGADNYFTLSQVTNIAFASSYNQVQGNPGLSVIQAYNIDKKMDDGFPITGKVTTVSALNGGELFFSNGDVNILNDGNTVPGGSPIPATSTTCYDNNNSTANKVQYSIAQNKGAGLNCSLSFQFQ